MGNCQTAADAAAVVIQHPGGKVERLHCPTIAAEVMRSNPGHRVALVTLCAPAEERQDGGRVTRVRLLGAKDVLLLGRVYRLVTSQGSFLFISTLFNFVFSLSFKKLSSLSEIAKAHEKLKKSRAELVRKQGHEQQIREGTGEDSETRCEIAKQERGGQRTITEVKVRGRHWRPSLQIISEMSS
ncbi:hypothetical protein ZIOFF_051628 [Zingiber officinale]|uniref:Uncharacterized protein n=1 Tax=Zingiber officinale TaxID=94328 RepID=A0A8J5KUS1_ZINOF|nr:hypothetical protein ZIOFF_051628 [Zingiber officinale]